MSKLPNPYGDGDSYKRIVAFMEGLVSHKTSMTKNKTIVNKYCIPLTRP